MSRSISLPLTFGLASPTPSASTISLLTSHSFPFPLPPMPLVKTNGINMAYEERGSGDPVICIMGVTAPGAAWDAQA